jgi:hypothetical protein
MQVNFSVQFEKFAESHFIKHFEKKYRNHWLTTRKAIIASLERIDALLLTDRAETISSKGSLRLIKTKFRVDGTKESAKTSGNRCIVICDFDKKIVAVLLVYGKTNLSDHNETAQWQSLVRANYPEYKNIL